MSSSIAAILALIYAMIILIISGVLPIFVHELWSFKSFITGLGLASIIIVPMSAYFVILAASFFTAMLYNKLVSRISGIKLGLEDNEVIKIPLISFSIVLASIEAIWAFIIGLFLAAVTIPFTFIIGLIKVIVNAVADSINFSVANLPVNLALGTDVITLIILLIIGLPLAVFIFGLISNVIFTLFYNYIATRFIKIQLEFEVITGSINELKALPVVPTALPVAGAVFAGLGAIMGLISLLSLAVAGNQGVGNVTNDLIVILVNSVIYFVGYFLIFALITLIYNFLAPRIGGIKLDII